MSDLRKAAQMALEALKKSHTYSNSNIDLDKHSESIAALRAALAQPEPIPGATPMSEYAAQSAAVPGRAEALKRAGYTRRPRQLPKEDEREPVAWRITDGEGDWEYFTDLPEDWSIQWSAQYGRKYEPLYTAPPHRTPLTNGEIYTAYITATNQTLRAQDEKLALEFARTIEKAHGIGV